MSQSINQWAMNHWSMIGLTDNYFAENGVFISFVWSAPLSIIGLLNASLLLLHSSQLMIVVKRKQLGVDKKTNKQSITQSVSHSSNQSNSQSVSQSTNQSNAQSIRRRNAEANQPHLKYPLD
jgi:hypothetical protein